MLLAACGDDEPSDGNGATAAPTEGQAGADDPTPAGDGFFLEIAAENTEYDVSELGPAPAGEDITPAVRQRRSRDPAQLVTLRDGGVRGTIFEGEILTGVDTIDYAVPAI